MDKVDIWGRSQEAGKQLVFWRLQRRREHTVGAGTWLGDVDVVGVIESNERGRCFRGCIASAPTTPIIDVDSPRQLCAAHAGQNSEQTVQASSAAFWW